MQRGIIRHPFENGFYPFAAVIYHNGMKFKAIFDKYPDAKVILCTTDFAVNFAYKDDEEFIRFTKEKIDLRNDAKRRYENRQETIRFYLYNIVSIALKLEGFEFPYLTWNYGHYDYDNELSKELIEKVRKLYRKYLPLYHRLIQYVIFNSCFKHEVADVLKKHLIRANLEEFFILGNCSHSLTLVVTLDEEVKDYLINEVKSEEELGSTYLEYALYKGTHLTRDEGLYGCIPHEDCLYEDEEEEE